MFKEVGSVMTMMNDIKKSMMGFGLSGCILAPSIIRWVSLLLCLAILRFSNYMTSDDRSVRRFELRYPL